MGYTIDKWDWFSLSSKIYGDWIELFIEKYKDKIIWGRYGLTANANISWTFDILNKYEEELQSSMSNMYDYHYYDDNHDNHSLKLHHYNNNCKWTIFIQNSKLPWTQQLIDRFENKWDWRYLSKNTTVLWSNTFIERYVKKWKWSILSNNEELPWSDSLIEQFKDYWDWDILSKKENNLWSIEHIEKFEDKWNWTILSENESVHYNDLLIEKYKWKWNWKNLSENKALPWSIEFIDEYKDFLVWEKTKNTLSYPTNDKNNFINNEIIFKEFICPILDDEYIISLFSEFWVQIPFNGFDDDLYF